MQLSQNNGNWSCVDWGNVAAWAGGGAVAGLFVYYALPTLLASPDSAFDLASLAFDAYTGDVSAFATDIWSLMTPGVPATGALTHADDALKALNQFDNATDTAHLANTFDNVYDSSHVAYRSVETIYGPYRQVFSSESQQATKIMEEAATISDVELSKYVDRVYFSPAQKTPFFGVSDLGERYVVLTIESIKGTRAHQLVVGSHELVHAQQFERLLRYRFNGDILAARDYFGHYGKFAYAFREVVAERLAFNRVERYLGEMPAFQVADSIPYILNNRDKYREEFRHLLD